MKKAIIGIYRHAIPCVIGVEPHEKSQKQTIWVDIEVETDIDRCTKEDDLRYAVNYVTLAKVCTEVACGNSYHLLETLADRMIERLLEEFPISAARVVIKKPLALTTARYAKVVLHRRKK